MEVPPTAAMRIHSAGLRPTAIRLAVLDVLETMPHAGVQDIAEAVQQVLGTASRQAVYDALDHLLVAQLVRRIEPAGSPARYEARVGDNHHHVVCRGCGRAADVDCAVGEVPCLEPSQTHGFVLDEAEVTFWGLCPQCHGTEDQDG
ncbi:MAG TPA: Fur family transcriptional regulator [Candidatus Dormibacteraeota bacterium]